VLAAVAGVHTIQLLGPLVQAAVELVGKIVPLLTQLLARQTRAVVVAEADILGRLAEQADQA
jgi:hypothetical protein